MTHALANLAAWVPSPGLYKLRPTSGGYEAIATWRESSTGQPLERRKRNLSIHRNGIADFGCGDKFTAIDLTMRALGVSQNDAFQWIYDRTNAAVMFDVSNIIDFKALTENLERKRLLRIAEREEKMRMSSVAYAVVDGLSRDNEGTLYNAETGEIIVERGVMVVSQDREFPDLLTRPPGLLGEIVDYIEATSTRPSRTLALGAAIVVMGTLCGRKDATPTRSGTHAYVIATRPTGCGKQHPQSCGALLLQKATESIEPIRRPDLVGPPNLMSQSALINHIEKRQLSASFVDEFGGLLGKMNSTRAGSHELGIKDVLLSAWGMSFQEYRTPAWAGAASRPIQSPAFSLFGASTPERFFEALQVGDRENGLLNRCLLLPTERKATKQKPLFDFRDVPDELVTGLRAVYMARRTLAIIDGGSPQTHVTPWGAGAEAAYDAFDAECDARDASEFFVRSAEIAVRLATICAIGRDPDFPEVSVDDMRWGVSVARWSAERMAADAGVLVADTAVGRDHARIVAKIQRAGGRINQRDVMRDLGFSLREMAERVRDLERDEIWRNRDSPKLGYVIQGCLLGLRGQHG